ncbi:MAG: methyl-accepting chemotaxis protein [Betaproteobacteria bacterium]|nr:methyl-accepting chemotaxis protein [Betaproteobacteria bacterium]
MLSAIQRFPLAQQTLIGVILVCVLAVAALYFTLSSSTRQVALQESQSALQTQTDLIARTLEYADVSMERVALAALEQFEKSLPPPRLTGATVNIGGATRPELMFGDDTRAIGNQAYLLAYKDDNPLNDPAILLYDGGNFYRATTLLKGNDGQYRDGSLVSDEYTQTLLEGKTYIGALQRSGKQYMLAAKPLKDSQGQVIGGIQVRVDINDNIKLLREKLGSIIIGKSGYPFIIEEASGDNKEALFVMHPTLQDKPINSIEEKMRPIFATIMREKSGRLSYAWPTANGSSQQKIAVFNEIPALKWIVVACAPEDEFTAPFDGIRHLSLIGLAGMTVLLVFCLALLIRAQLRPLDRVAHGLMQMGEGNLTYHVESRNDSRNEIDLLATHVNETRDAMKALVSTIKESANKVAASASSVFESMQQLSTGIDGLSSSSSEISNSIGELSTSISHIAEASDTAHSRAEDAVSKVGRGKQVVHDVISSIQVIENRVHSSLSEVETLTTHSHKIEKVIATIGAIAAQTNLLALNAAIEAARAGEVGRGFAVVADEVRKLAEQSALSANEISEVLSHVTSGVTAVQASIREVVDEAKKGTESSGAAGGALDEIESITRDIADSVISIADTTRQQAAAAQAMMQQVTASAQVTEETGNITHSVSQNSADLKTEAEKLAGEAGHFVI